MLLGEGNRLLNGVGERDGVGDGRAGVVGVAGPVNLAALHHHEETGVIVQHLDPLLHIVGERPHILGAVIFIGKGVRVGQMLVNDENGAGGDGLGLSLGHDHLIARLSGQIVEAGLVLGGAGGLQQPAAGEVLEAGGHQLLSNFVVVAAAGLMGIESGRGGVVQVDAGNHTDLPAELLPKLFGNGLVSHSGGLIHIDGAGVGLVAGGDGGGGGS